MMPRLVLSLAVLLVATACEYSSLNFLGDAPTPTSTPIAVVQAPTPIVVAPKIRMKTRIEKYRIREIFPGVSGKAVGSWHAFAKSKYNGRIGGSIPSISNMAKDFGNLKSRYFRSEGARQVLVLVGGYIRPDIITSRQTAGALLGQIASSSDIRMISCKLAVGGQMISPMAIDNAGNTRWTERECDPDENVVQLKGFDGSWINWFSLKCLNPLDDQWTKVVAVIAAVLPSPSPTIPTLAKVEEACPEFYPFPTGMVSNNQEVFLFLTPNEAKCIPPEWTCKSSECDDWMAGNRGEVPWQVRDKHTAGGRAYAVKPGVAGIYTPANSSPWWCNQQIHARFVAKPLVKK